MCTLHVLCKKYLFTCCNVREGRNLNTFIQRRPMFRRYGHAALQFKIFNSENVCVYGASLTTLSGNTDVGKVYLLKGADGFARKAMIT